MYMYYNLAGLSLHQAEIIFYAIPDAVSLWSPEKEVHKEAEWALHNSLSK